MFVLCRLEQVIGGLRTVQDPFPELEVAYYVKHTYVHEHFMYEHFMYVLYKTVEQEASTRPLFRAPADRPCPLILLYVYHRSSPVVPKRHNTARRHSDNACPSHGYSYQSHDRRTTQPNGIMDMSCCKCGRRQAPKGGEHLSNHFKS